MYINIYIFINIYICFIHQNKARMSASSMVCRDVVISQDLSKKSSGFGLLEGREEYTEVRCKKDEEI